MTVAAPLIWPLLLSAVLIGLWRHGEWQRYVAAIGSVVHVILSWRLFEAASAGDPLVHVVGAWQPPFGIVLVADRLAAVMVLTTAILGLAISIYSLSGIDKRREAFGFQPLVQALLTGVCGAFLTGDLFNLFVWFEVMLMASFVLLALGGEKKQMAGALQYVSLNLISSMVFLLAMGLLYGMLGSLNMADVAQKLPQSDDPGLAAIICCLLAFAFGVKAALFPVYVWLPASYHTPPTVVTALFGALLTKVGVYALMRSTSLFFVESAPFLLPVLMLVGGLTMVLGVLGAVAQGEMRRLLSFHIVSQIGYMVFGIALMTPAGLSAAILYVLHNMLVKTNLFLIGGIARRMCHSEKLKEMGGLFQRAPLLAALFALSAASLAGLPPLSGFWAKLFLIRAGFLAEEWILTSVALGVSFLTLFSMLKLWNEVFWKPAPDHQPAAPDPQLGKLRWRYLPVFGLTALTLAFGFFAGDLLQWSDAAAAQLLDRQLYIRSVLEARP